MMKTMVVLHRYLGVVLGLLMVLWCLSGFVMMYQGYPLPDRAERLKGLQPLHLTPAEARADLGVPDDDAFTGFRIEMMAGRPVIHLLRGPGRREAHDLENGGSRLDMVSVAQALAVAQGFARGNGIGGSAKDVGEVTVNQWTLDGINRAGPMRHIVFGDRAGTDVYVAERTGEIVQKTTAQARVVAWLGAIPHWLYPTILRKNPPLWDAVVVGTSSIGVFLTAFGVYLGVMRFRKYKSGRWSPYRGWFYWHHIVGLVFGVLTLTWVASGLFTMSPFGLFETRAGQTERLALAGPLTGAEAKAFLKLAPAIVRDDTATLEAAPFGGKLYVMATTRGGGVLRLDGDGRPAPLTQAEVSAALAPALNGRRLAALDRLDKADAYYYDGYERAAAFPVWRARLDDAQHTLFYIDGTTGRMVKAVDGAARQSRFWRQGLHDFDFAFMRARPLWDIIVLILMAGVTGTCITGFWLAIRRIGLDIGGLKARLTPK